MNCLKAAFSRISYSFVSRWSDTLGGSKGNKPPTPPSSLLAIRANKFAGYYLLIVEDPLYLVIDRFDRL